MNSTVSSIRKDKSEKEKEKENEQLVILNCDINEKYHYKQINCLSTKDDLLFTGGKDSFIKLWDFDKFNHKSNLFGHMDWINDMCFNEDKSILFSCSNDCKINIWDLKGTYLKNHTTTIFPIFSYSDCHKDYIKRLHYNSAKNYLYSCGLDSKICIYPIVDGRKYNIDVSNENIYTSFNDISVYTITTNLTGNLLFAGLYQNDIKVFDIISNKEVMTLDRQPGISLDIRMTNVDNLLISCSSDCVTMYDLRYCNKIIKNWTLKGSLTCFEPTNNFNNFFSADTFGNIFLTNILSDNFTIIDNINQPVKNIHINSSNEYLFVNSDSKLMKYNLPKNVKSKTSEKSVSSNSFKLTNDNEIIEYRVLNSKLYILIRKRSEVICLFSIVKLKIIHSFVSAYNPIINKTKILDNYTVLEEKNISIKQVYDLISSFDTLNFKSWFIVNIKNGFLKFTFDKSSLLWKQSGTISHVINDKILFDYLDNVKNSSNGFMKIKNVDKIKSTFSKDQLKEILKSPFFNSLNEADILDFLITPFYIMFNSIYRAEINKNLTSKNLTKRNDMIISNFLNYDEYLKKYEYSLKINKENISNSKEKDSSLYFDSNEVDYKNLLCKHDYNNLIIYLSSDTNNKNTILFDQLLILGYSNFNKSIFKFFSKNDLPKSFMKLIDLEKGNNSKDSKDKFDVTIYNKYKHFKKKNCGTFSDEIDDVEVSGSVTVGRFKEWLFKSYIDKNYFLQKINSMISNNQKVKEQIQKDNSSVINFIDIEINYDMIVLNVNLTLGELRSLMLEKDEKLAIILKIKEKI